MTGVQTCALPISEGRVVDEKWKMLYKKSLDLGWSLLKASFNHVPTWSKEEFLQKLKTLSEEVKGNLFQQQFTLGPSELNLADKAICDILVKIKDKWRKDDTSQDNALEKSTIYQENKEVLDAADITPAADRKETGSREEDQETVIISLNDLNE